MSRDCTMLDKGGTMAELNPWAIMDAVIFFGGLLAFPIPKAIKAQRPRRRLPVLKNWKVPSGLCEPP